MALEVIPWFPASDLDRTVAFWSDLGFVERRRDDGFLAVRHPIGVELHFWLDENLDTASNSVSAYLRFTAADEAQGLYDEWAASMPATGTIHAPETRPYGLLEWMLLDHDRNLLRVGART